MMAVNYSNWLEVAVNYCKLQEMAESGWIGLYFFFNGWKYLDMAENGLKGLDMAGNSWKFMKMARRG